MILARTNGRNATGETTRAFHLVFRSSLTIALLWLLPVFMQGQNIPPAPNPPRLVNDFAGLLSRSEVNALERKLVDYSDSTSTQIAIVTIETLEGQDVGVYGAELLQKWGVGTKENYNGVVILISKNDRKTTIRTGFGVESKLNTIVCQNIVDNTLLPNFKSGNYYQGLNDATDEMIGRLSGTFQGDGKHGKRKKIPVWAILIILFFVFGLPFLFRNRRGGTFSGRGYSSGPFWMGGGGFGGGGGGFGGFGGGGASGGGASGGW